MEEGLGANSELVAILVELEGEEWEGAASFSFQASALGDLETVLFWGDGFGPRLTLGFLPCGMHGKEG